MTVSALLAVLLIDLMGAMSPGPAFLLSIRTAATEGFRPAAAYAFGVGVGSVVWALAALSGLALLFQIAPALLTLFKLAGALYLIRVAILTWRNADRPMPDTAAATPPRSIASAVRLGLFTQLANPKSAVFYGAVFVGLVPPGTPLPAIGSLLAGICLLETLWFVLIARLFSLDRIRAAYGAVKSTIERVFGGLLMLLGLKLAAL